ncbi:hypothetical protein T11_1669 [Trichinella zimbabwensis]|uniref:Uncharacterized protein n=1 Tax=Trichinella zimbabwensis TaxID=268475 RepID=A0A0V1H7N7_9BILA|nr:hypothetical protein T11_1669 [Trichinella zimbabwensis]
MPLKQLYVALVRSVEINVFIRMHDGKSGLVALMCYIFVGKLYSRPSAFAEQLVLSVAESVIPWLTCVTKTNHISRRSKLNPSASRDDDIPAFYCQRWYEILYYEVEFVIGNKVLIWHAKERVVICLNVHKNWPITSFPRIEGRYADDNRSRRSTLSIPALYPPFAFVQWVGCFPVAGYCYKGVVVPLGNVDPAIAPVIK